MKTTKFDIIEIEFSLIYKVMVLMDATTKTENLKRLSFLTHQTRVRRQLYSAVP